jgi:GNS1/SUR4 family
MVVGTATTLAGYYYLRNDDNCSITSKNVTAGFLMYGSYLFLFGQFFVSRYFCKATRKRAKQESAEKKAQ